MGRHCYEVCAGLCVLDSDPFPIQNFGEGLVLSVLNKLHG